MKIIGDNSPIIMGKEIKCVKNKNWIRMKRETKSTKLIQKAMITKNPLSKKFSPAKLEAIKRNENNVLPNSVCTVVEKRDTCCAYNLMQGRSDH